MDLEAAERSEMRISELEDEITALRAELARYKAEKNQAYTERNRVVLALAMQFPAGIRDTQIEGWSPEWNGCCYIDLPTGQISYHYHSSEAELFNRLPAYKKPYDGHTKDDVHARLLALRHGPDMRWAEDFIHERRAIARSGNMDLHAHEIAAMVLWMDELEKQTFRVRIAHQRGCRPEEVK